MNIYIFFFHLTYIYLKYLNNYIKLFKFYYEKFYKKIITLKKYNYLYNFIAIIIKKICNFK